MVLDLQITAALQVFVLEMAWSDREILLSISVPIAILGQWALTDRCAAR